MHFIGIYKQELWERLNFVEAVQRRGMPLFNYANSQKIIRVIIEMDNNNPVGSCNTLLSFLNVYF